MADEAIQQGHEDVFGEEPIKPSATSSGSLCAATATLRLSDLPCWRVKSARGMIARFDGIEQLAVGSMGGAAGKPPCTVNV
jgi:hypothetical protein